VWISPKTPDFIGFFLIFLCEKEVKRGCKMPAKLSSFPQAFRTCAKKPILFFGFSQK